jgi:hypothetical protein
MGSSVMDFETSRYVRTATTGSITQDTGLHSSESHDQHLALRCNQSRQLSRGICDETLRLCSGNQALQADAVDWKHGG